MTVVQALDSIKPRSHRTRRVASRGVALTRVNAPENQTNLTLKRRYGTLRHAKPRSHRSRRRARCERGLTVGVDVYDTRCDRVSYDPLTHSIDTMVKYRRYK